MTEPTILLCPVSAKERRFDPEQSGRRKNHPMKNESKWKPTRCVKSEGRFRPLIGAVSPGSYLVCRLAFAAYYEAITKHIRGDILDCGCGKVPYYEMYKDNSSSITCIDWQVSPGSINHIDEAGDLNEGLPYSDESFDGVILTDVLEHLHSPSVLLEHVYRTLRPGGKVVVGVPFLYNIHEAPHDYYRYTEFSLRRLFDLAGFDVVELQPYGGYFDSLFNQIHKFKSRSRALFYGTEWIRKAFMKIPPLRRRNDLLAPNYPLGYCAVITKGRAGANEG